MIDLSLGRIRGLLDKLGRPQERLPPVIHVAGTNGKGSTVAFMLAMLQAAGKRVHTYTSPHLVRFNERIQLAGADGRARPIADEALADALARVSEANGDEPMTFFEITTAAAFLAFAETPADVVILEVGLGGRLDATNLVERPALSVITPVSIDHADKLGDTLEQIAFEKAGILKPGVDAVIATQPPEALSSIRQTADRVGAGLIVQGEDFDAFEERGRLVFQSEQRLMDLPLPALIGRNQVINAGVAIAAMQQSQGTDFPTGAIESGLQTAIWPARFSRVNSAHFNGHISPQTELWLDGGHNPAAGAGLAQTLADLEERAPKPAFLIVGMMGQKDAVGFLRPFAGLVRGVRTVGVPGEANAMPAEQLAGDAQTAGLAAKTSSDVESALRDIEASEAGAKRVLICGSLYLAGHVLGRAEAPSTSA